MNAQKIFSFLFSFRGRMNRRNFLISILSLILVGILLIYLNNKVIPDPQPRLWDIIVFTFVPLLIISFLAFISRRLHDSGRGFGGFLAILFLMAICILLPYPLPFLGWFFTCGQIIALGLAVFLVVNILQPTDFEDETYGPAPKCDAVSEENTMTEEEQRLLEEYNRTHLNGILLEPAEEDDQMLFEEADPDWSIS